MNICIIWSVSTIFYAYNVTIDDVNYVLPLKRERDTTYQRNFDGLSRIHPLRMCTYTYCISNSSLI